MLEQSQLELVSMSLREYQDCLHVNEKRAYLMNELKRYSHKSLPHAALETSPPKRTINLSSIAPKAA